MTLDWQRGLLLFLCITTLVRVLCYSWYFAQHTETPNGDTKMLQNASPVKMLQKQLNKQPNEQLYKESNEQVNMVPSERLKTQPNEQLHKKPTEKLKTQSPKQSNEQLTKKSNEQLTNEPNEQLSKEPNEQHTEEPNGPNSASDGPWKTILFWTTWFGKNWSKRWGATNSTELKLLKCPSWRCHFTYNRSLSSTADAVVYEAGDFNPKNLPPPHPRPDYQRWVWVNVEPQSSPITRTRVTGLKIHNLNRLINYTMIPHQESDVYGFNGYFLSLGAKQRPLRPNLMTSHGEAMAKYLKAYEEGRTLKDVMGAEWSTFVRRPHPVAWMVSHCSTLSRREDYVKELQKYIEIGTYGSCGNRTCYSQSALNSQCWVEELSQNYSFYLTMENSLCQDYITEKLYNPMVYNMVPVVWGGSDYSLYLPPHSYINARHYHPKDLARLLLRLHKDPIAYGRYHLWRGYFQVHVQGSLCELCHLLHTDHRHRSHTDIGRWINETSHCTSLSKPLFSNPNFPDMWRAVINQTKSEL